MYMLKTRAYWPDGRIKYKGPYTRQQILDELRELTIRPYVVKEDVEVFSLQSVPVETKPVTISCWSI